MPADDADPPSALPRGTRLGEYEIRRVLGIGGFGIVYLAFDHALEREVAIKEYMPGSLAGRSPATLEVAVLSQSNHESFALGLRSFVNEARLLARFDHPSLVKVHRYWEAHHTAYMAMPYYAGQNLQQVRRGLREPPGEAWLRSVLEPLLGALDRLHREGVFHRDVSPDNVLLEPDGRPVLLDFGAARRVIGDRSVALTAILKPAYAPIEQYGEAGAVKQGPWTDLYALGATLHFLLLGRAPPPATTRTVHDELQPLAQQALPGCSERFLRCVDWMLQPRPADRPQQVADLREALAGRREPPLPAEAPARGLPALPDLAGSDPAPADAPTVRRMPAADAAAWAPTTVLAPPAAPGTTHGAVAAQGPDSDAGAGPDVGLDGPLPGSAFGATSHSAPTPPAAAPGLAAAPAPTGPDATPATAPAATRTEPPGTAAGPAAPAAPATPPRAARWPLPAAVGAALMVGMGVWWSLHEAPALDNAPPAAATVASAAAPPVAAAPAPLLAASPASTPAVAAPDAAGRQIATAPVAPAPALAAPAGQPSGPERTYRWPKLPPPPGPSAAPKHAAATGPAGGAPAAAAAPAAANPATPAMPAAAPPQPVRPAAQAAGPRPSAQTAPAALEPETDNMVLKARVLSPSERCEGRMLLARWACIERQCNRVPELRNHPECVKLRREAEQRNEPR